MPATYREREREREIEDEGHVWVLPAKFAAVGGGSGLRRLRSCWYCVGVRGGVRLWVIFSRWRCGEGLTEGGRECRSEGLRTALRWGAEDGVAVRGSGSDLSEAARVMRGSCCVYQMFGKFRQPWEGVGYSRIGYALWRKEQAEEINEPKPGPMLYGFYKPHSLDVEITWTETHNAFVPANFTRSGYTS